MKRMYVVQSEQGGFWCGLNHWDTQLRKAQIFHSLKYAGDVVERFKQYNPKTVEVSLTIVNESQTNADRIRAMSDEELAKLLLSADQGNFTVDICSDEFCVTEEKDCPHDCTSAALKWLKQPVKDGENDG